MGNKQFSPFGGEELKSPPENNNWDFVDEKQKDSLFRYRTYSARSVIQFNDGVFHGDPKTNWRELKHLRIAHETIAETVVLLDSKVELVSELGWNNFNTRYCYRIFDKLPLPNIEDSYPSVIFVVDNKTHKLNAMSYNLDSGSTMIEFRGFPLDYFKHKGQDKNLLQYKLSFN